MRRCPRWILRPQPDRLGVYGQTALSRSTSSDQSCAGVAAAAFTVVIVQVLLCVGRPRRLASKRLAMPCKHDVGPTHSLDLCHTLAVAESRKACWDGVSACWAEGNPRRTDTRGPSVQLTLCWARDSVGGRIWRQAGRPRLEEGYWQANSGILAASGRVCWWPSLST